jgi:hypothetical protein
MLPAFQCLKDWTIAGWTVSTTCSGQLCQSAFYSLQFFDFLFDDDNFPMCPLPEIRAGRACPHPERKQFLYLAKRKP